MSWTNAAGRLAAARLRIDPLVPIWLLLPAAAWIGRGFTNGLTRDAALYVYAGQAVAAGEPPYVAVMNRAGPLAHLLPGLGVVLGRLVGVDDVTGVRVLYFAMATLTPVAVYLLVRTVYGSRLGGCVAAASMMSFQMFVRLSTTGPDSKQPMVLFLIVALLLLVRRQMLAAGVLTALATLTWQPALVVAAGAAVVIGLTSDGGWRGRAHSLVRFGLGGLATLAATVGYFAVVGAVDAFLDGFWRANAGYTVQPSLLSHAGPVWDGLSYWYGWTIWLLLGGCVLAPALAGWLLLRGGGHDRLPGEVRHGALALGVATASGVAWCFYAFNASPDALPVLPLAAAGLGGCVAALTAAVPRPSRARTVVAAGVTGFVVVATAATVQLAVSTGNANLLKDRAAAAAVFARLPEDATAMSVEAPQPLALAGRRSISRYVLFSFGMAAWVDADRPGGLPAYRVWLREQAPDVLFARDVGRLPGSLTGVRSDYVLVGRRPQWQVLLHQDVDVSVRREVAAALARGRGPGGRH